MNGDIVFHSCCFLGRDHDIDSNNDGDSGSDEDPDFPKEPTYYVHIFGKSELGESVHVQVKFPPFAFMEISNSWTQIQVKQFIKELPPYLKKQMSLDDCKLVYRKKFYGFTNNTDYKFIRLMFRTHKGMRNFDAYAKERGHSMYESNVDPILKLFHVQDLEASGWLRIPLGKYKQGERTTWCTHNYVCMWHDLVSLPDKTTVVPLVVASFDIEVMSVDDSFPDPDVDGNDVIQIATTLTKHGEREPFLKHLINLGHCNPIGDDVQLVCCDTEIGVLNAWRKLLIEHHVDIILGYNIWGFDLSFMYKRAVYNDPGCDFMNLGKFRDEPSVMKKTILSSAAYGHNEFQILQTPGILQIDLMHVIRKEHKLESYSLNKVSEVFLGEHKIDMPAKELFRLWRIGDPESKKKIAEYCVQDTALPAKILVKLGILSNMIEMSKATHVPMEWLLPRGQQIKCFSQILKYIRKRSMLCPATSFGERKVDKFEGATVLPPLRGAYVNDIVSCLDFASLYPSIMRAENLCHSTLVTESKFDNLEGVEYGEYKTDTKTYRFVQNIPGVLPELLEDLAKFRKKAKKEMAEAKKRGDDFMYNVYNGKQLAYKVSMNSVYGFTGAANGFLPCVPIASAVTATGRKMIEHTKEMVEREYPGSQVIYGDTDSVFCRFGKHLDMHETFKIAEEAAQLVTKTFKHPNELEFEKCYSPLLLFAKKRYSGLMYTKPDKSDYLDSKGIQLVRRDNCPLVKTISKGILDKIMYEKDIDGAMEFAREQLRLVMSGKVDIKEFILSKTLRVGYKNDNLPHLQVARKIEDRNGPGSGPKSGERVPFVFVQTKGKKDLGSTKAEDPTYVTEQGLKIDLLYYLKHQLESPVVSLFELIVDDPYKVIIEEIEKEYTKSDTYIESVNKMNKQTNITSFFGAKK